MTFKISILNTLKEGNHLLKGSKGPLWAVILPLFLIPVLLQATLYTIFHINPHHPPFLLHFIIIPLVSSFLLAPLSAGAMMIAIKRARGNSVDFATGYSYFSQYLSLSAATVMITILSSVFMWFFSFPMIAIHLTGLLGKFIFLLAGLYALIIYVFLGLSLPLIADQNKTVFEALQLSMQLIRTQWLRVVILIAISAIIVLLGGFLAGIPLFIAAAVSNKIIFILGLAVLALALVWLLPYPFLIWGIIYNKLTDQSIERNAS